MLFSHPPRKKHKVGLCKLNTQVYASALVASFPLGDPGRNFEPQSGMSQSPVYCDQFLSNSQLGRSQSNNKRWKCLNLLNYQVPEFT